MRDFIRLSSQPEIGQSRVIVGTTTCRPMKIALAIANRDVVDARNASLHEPTLVEFPVLVAVGTESLARVVMPLVGKAQGDAVAVECPKFLDEPIVQFPVPLAG